ncbi:hypothetical protein BDF20DRAFT_677894 [Mycotypha africana]|uniref:uncharacterized protein n=1 Tax=Mycotypha africana TaxID=64632 RepID=UPI0023011CF2|nr:uncharacterized protein BDF20DRAFT_677894 [Mycotypha africana]KAI8973839.1 hypothetical protein BDF20DRAFT_677894 [Mycotypha africana]
MSKHFTSSQSGTFYNIFKNTSPTIGSSLLTPFKDSSTSDTCAETELDPFNGSALPKVDEKQATEEDESIEDLNHRFIASQLLDDDNIDFPPDNQGLNKVASITEPKNASKNYYRTNGGLLCTPVSPINSSISFTSNSTNKSIWETTTTRITKSVKEDNYYGNDYEFDPTLQYYHGELYDTATIRDLDRLSLQAQVPSTEELQDDNVEEDMSSLQMLQTIFKDLSEAELIAALETYDYDADAAIDKLIQNKILKKTGEQQELKDEKEQQYTPSSQKATAPTVQMINEAQVVERASSKINIAPPLPSPAAAASLQQSYSVRKKRQVCRHFLAGECYRKDCWFSHDLQDKICKFWLQGSCLKGNACEFSHNIDLQEIANKITTTTTSALPTAVTNLYNSEEYPALMALGNDNKKSIASTQSITNSQRDVSVEEEFPTLASAAKIASNKKVVNKSSSTKATNFADVAKKKKDEPIKTKQLLMKNNKYRYSSQSYRYTTHELSQPVHIPWLETGSSLNSVYLKERQKAIEYGTLRNRFFNKATEFYLKGDGAKAKLYSMEAKHYNRLMREMHAEASKRIFESRSKNQAFIDLHGLHEDEAMEIVDERLRCLKGKYSGIIYIVTGTGNHSGSSGLSKKQSKLKPIVYRYLKDHYYHFAEASIVNDDQGGIYAVELL